MSEITANTFRRPYHSLQEFGADRTATAAHTLRRIRPRQAEAARKLTVCGGLVAVNPRMSTLKFEVWGYPLRSKRADLVKNRIIRAMSRVKEAQSEPGLGIETSGAFGSVALGLGDTVCDRYEFATPRAHAVDFLPAIARLCRTHDVAPADLAYVFLSIGPGSFTGLRIGVSAARMIALSTQAKIVGVPTLTVIAQNANLLPQPPSSVTVLLDAKRRRVYAASFRRVSGFYRCDDAPEEVDPGAFLATRPEGCAVLGEGVLAHREVTERSGLVVLPEELYRARAETVYALGLKMAKNDEIVHPRLLVPDYIRRPEAEERWDQRQADGTAC